MERVEYNVYRVWDRGIRGFHWINVLAVLTLLGTGLVIYNGKTLGLSGEPKILMKELHVWAGYLFAANLLWRIFQGFLGGEFARWRSILPFRRDFPGELSAYLASLRSGEPRHYRGHNPLGRLMILALLVLLFGQAFTGLTLAGTDLYYPPLGSWIAGWVAPAGVEPASLIPGDKSMVDAAAWADMRAFRKPFITVHVQVFFFLIAAVLLHIAGVVAAEIKGRSGLVSAMISGYKVLPKPPVDAPAPETKKEKDSMRQRQSQ